MTLLGKLRRSKLKEQKYDQVDRWIDGWFYPKKDDFSEADQIQMICTDVKLMAGFSDGSRHAF